jgi:hypothetical protein
MSIFRERKDKYDRQNKKNHEMKLNKKLEKTESK